jgi:hypothetical protein
VLQTDQQISQCTFSAHIPLNLCSMEITDTAVCAIKEDNTVYDDVVQLKQQLQPNLLLQQLLLPQGRLPASAA